MGAMVMVDAAKDVYKRQGEALVSFLDEEGKPCIVEYAKILPPQCRMAAADPDVLAQALAAQSALIGKYGDAIDRESAYELLNQQAEDAAAQDALAAERAALEAEKAEFEAQKAKETEKAAKEAEKKAAADEAKAAKEAERKAIAAEKQAQKAQDQLTRQVGSVLGQIGREASRQIIRGIFGGLKK